MNVSERTIRNWIKRVGKAERLLNDHRLHPETMQWSDMVSASVELMRVREGLSELIGSLERGP